MEKRRILFGMNYYGVWVRTPRYHGDKPLTYAWPGILAAGSIVRVPLQRESVLGVVVGKTTRPSVANVKRIEETYPLRPLTSQLLELSRWLMAYYPSPIGVATQLLLPPLIPKRLPEAKIVKAWMEPKLPSLTPEQQRALPLMRQPGSYLLHGRTGSGKTRLYQELALDSLRLGRSVLILSPEIGLTSQLVAQFEVFGKNNVVVLHSKLSPAERFAAWYKISQSKQPLIVVGPRSALFSPLRDIGLIVVDEAHDSAYKQEQPPHYQANRVAAQLASLHGSTLIYGSATPLVSEYYLAKQKERPIIRLSHLAMSSDHAASTELIDLRDRDRFSRSPHLSDALLTSIKQSLARGEQSLLYLNRRGTARLALCQNCGWQALCPNCDLPLTYHADKHLLRCHVCNYHTTVPTSCPICRHTELLYKSIGTKAIAEEVSHLFPDARVMRFDSDNTKQERLEQHFAAIERGDVDILVGTQTLAKGLDLPKLSTLGVITADTSLYVPDYTADEQTYQLINQVLGRVSRGHRPTKAFIQAYAVDHPAIRLALTDDWDQFYEAELAQRELFKYPPYVSLLKLSCRRKSAAAAKRACETLVNHIKSVDPSILIDGPAPALHEKFHDNYQWQVILKATRRKQLLDILKNLPGIQYTFDIDPVNLL